MLSLSPWPSPVRAVPDRPQSTGTRRVLVDVGHVRDRFPSDALGRDLFHVAKPDVRIEPRVDHLQQIVVLEVPGDLTNDHRRLALGLQPLVERDQALVVLAVLPRVNLLAGQIFDRSNCRRAGCGDQDFIDVAARGIREVDQRLQLGRTVTCAATASTFPSSNADASTSRGNGTKATWTLKAASVRDRLSSSSNAFPSS